MIGPAARSIILGAIAAFYFTVAAMCLIAYIVSGGATGSVWRGIFCTIGFASFFELFTAKLRDAGSKKAQP